MELKFRAWDTVTKEMYSHESMCDPAGDGTSLTFKEFVEFPLKGVVVMQFTGLRDKNGRDIYDGDVIKDGAGQAFPITFGAGGYWFNWLHLVDVLEPWEVIGDIYSNPDLLK